MIYHINNLMVKVYILLYERGQVLKYHNIYLLLVFYIYGENKKKQ
jgi:hypothetical protein